MNHFLRNSIRDSYKLTDKPTTFEGSELFSAVVPSVPERRDPSLHVDLPPNLAPFIASLSSGVPIGASSVRMEWFKLPAWCEEKKAYEPALTPWE
eukprot:3708881-Pyramimonas_sp.AAC.1